MKIIIKESSIVHLVSTFLDGIDHPKEICQVESKLNDKGEIILVVHIKTPSFVVYGSGLTFGKIREYYSNKVSSYFGLPVHIYFELTKC